MTIWLETIDQKRLACREILSCEITAALDAACDSLRVWLYLPDAPGEVVRIQAEADGQLLFSGLTDRQTAQYDENGFRCFFYARSEAAVLVDNEAEPMTLYCPGTDSVLALTAAPFGFTSSLAPAALQVSFDVTKGMSLYAVLSEFYWAATGKDIWIDSEKCIHPAEPGALYSFAPDTVLQARAIINRAEPISTVDYKSDGDTAYSRHCKSLLAEEAGIRRTRKISLNGTPVWLRKNKAARWIQTAINGYMQAELTLKGLAPAQLCGRVELNSEPLGLSGTYAIQEINRRITQSGSVTELRLGKICNAKEMHYVDQ